jgi:hypothetical protein
LSVNGVLDQRGHDARIRFVAVPLDGADAILQADKAVVLDLCTKISVVSSTDLLSSERLLQLNLVDGRQG